MMRKLLPALAALLLLLASSALAEDTLQVYDVAGELSFAEEQTLASAIEEIENKHQIDIAVLITDNLRISHIEDEMKAAMRYADDFYEMNGFGAGPDNSGMLYMIDVRNRIQWISTEGVMIEYINDYREEKIFDKTQSHLKNRNWYKACRTAVRTTGEMMDDGRMRGFFLYDEVTGERLSGIYNPLETFEILLGAGVGVAAAAGICFIVAGSYNLRGKTYTYDSEANSEITFELDEKTFLRQVVSKRPRSTSSGGSGGFSGGGRSGGLGSGVHRSSSGRIHGGGGRRF